MSTRNFSSLFEPSSIALIGASNEPNSVGMMLARNLQSGGFDGPLWHINPHETAIAGAPCYPSVSTLPGTPDLAVVATPPATIPGLIGELAEKGCRAAVVITAGVGSDIEGRNLRQEMLSAAKPSLFRIVGPNCLGLISPGRGINASFALGSPRAGDIALVSQSGAIIAAMLDWAEARRIGFSHVVSLGDMADADFGDMLDFLAADQSTRSILLYVESISHARKFMSAARLAARTKPVVVVKAGRSAAGAKAALSHTGALAGSDAVYDAAFRRAGLLRVAELGELFEAASTLATGARLGGDCMMILTNGGGAGVLAADALIAQGGRLAELRPEALAALDAVLPRTWSRSNPVDILGDADGDRYTAALEVLAGEPDCDALLVINCPTAVADGRDAAKAVCAGAAKPHRPLFLTNWLGGATAQSSRETFIAHRIATFESPEDAARAFGHLVDHRRNQALLMETPEASPAIDTASVVAARELVQGVLSQGRSLLNEAESKQLLVLFGIPTVETLAAATPEEAGRLSAGMGKAVALKILSPDITHKSDVGGVVLDLRSPQDVEGAARSMLARITAQQPDARLAGFTVQRMISRPNAVELIAGVATDSTFGPIVLFGHGGKATEIIADRAIGLPPLNTVLARDMIARTSVAKLLAGYRDVAPVSIEALADVLIRLSEMRILLPQLRELDINPLLADGSGLIALDARVVVGPAETAVRLAIAPYPRQLEGEVATRNGTHYAVRPIRPDDEHALTEMVARCRAEDLRLRFFGEVKALPHELAARLSQIDYDREMAFVALGANKKMAGVVRLIADPENESAEFAVLVRSDLCGQGLGYALMQLLLEHARSRGLKRVVGNILPENATMLKMAGELGFQLAYEANQGPVTRATIRLG